jgi:dolichyl-phosphate beta-glucosyltransferase
VLCDADLHQAVAEVPKLEAALERGADLVIGSRWPGDGECARMQPFHRRMAGRIFHRLACAVLDLQFEDTQCGLKAMTLGAAARIFPLLTIDGWGYDTELIHVALLHGLQVEEVNLRIVHDYSESKFQPWNDGWRTFLEVFRTRWRSACGAYRPLAAAAVENGNGGKFQYECESGAGAAACLLQNDDGRLPAGIRSTETAGTSRVGGHDHML